MKKYLAIAFIIALSACCSKNSEPQPEPAPEPEPTPVTEEVFAKGADIGWVTEMESKGYKFYDADGVETECTALMKKLGCNAVRHRVWVNPSSDHWCDKSDLLVKCLRAKALGMDIMEDFHYSDCWADPGQQNVPAAWTGHSSDQLAQDVAGHTKDVLNLLKSNDIDVKWVQVGNEVTNGMLWETCRVKDQSASSFVKVFNAGRDAVKEVYKDAVVILHVDNGWNMETLSWYFDLMKKTGASYDMIGLSLYPSYWDDAVRAYPDWNDKVSRFLNNISKLHSNYSKPVMLCEFGMPASEPEKAKAALQKILSSTSSYDWFKGVFLWEPESENSRNGYDYGAFKDGKATSAMDPFKD